MALTHNLYVNNIASLVIDDSYFHDANVGHQIKSRAQSTTITNSRIYDGTGTGSYSIDLPNGGVGVIRDNVIQQGPNSDNPAIIHYGGESAAYAGSSLLIEDNVVVNDMSGSSSVRLLYNATTVTGTLSDNAVYGLTAGQIATGGATVSGTTFLSTHPTLDTSATGLQADLEVSSLALGNASVVQGQALGFAYIIVNNGAAQSNLGYGSFYIDGIDEAHFRGTNLTDPLGWGASRTLFNGFNTSNLSVGQHTLWVGADNFGQTSESNETNNWQSITFTVTAPPQADLVVSNLGLGTASVAQGQNLGFVYTIVNNGAGQSNLGYGGFYIDGMDAAHFRGLQPHRSAGVGGVTHAVQRLQHEQSQRRPAHAVGRGRQFRPDERERRDQQLAVDHLHGDGAAAGGPRGEQPRPGQLPLWRRARTSASSIPSRTTARGSPTWATAASTSTAWMRRTSGATTSPIRSGRGRPARCSTASTRAISASASTRCG